MKQNLKLLPIWLFSLAFAAGALTALVTFSVPVGKGLLRDVVPSAEELKDSVKKEEYKKLEDQTDLIRGSIKTMIDSLL